MNSQAACAVRLQWSEKGRGGKRGEGGGKEEGRERGRKRRRDEEREAGGSGGWVVELL